MRRFEGLAHGLGPLTHHHKSVPPAWWSLPAATVLAQGPRLSAWQSPVAVLDRGALEHNSELLTRWATERGLELAMHGKTVMAPALWRATSGAGGTLTVATPWQAQIARHTGINSILLANTVSDPVGLRWIANQLDADPSFALVLNVDSMEGLELLELTPGWRPFDVLVELGAPGGRGGVRTQEAALALATAVSRSPRARLLGVSGYEGVVGPDRSPGSVAAVKSFVADVVSALLQAQGCGLVEGPGVVSLGGSGWLDVVADGLAGLDPAVRRIVRPGAFLLHDHGHYAALSPFRAGASEALRPALTVLARVLSAPEPGCAVLDAGRRDVGEDQGRPIVLAPDGRPVAGATVTALNDQHAIVTGLEHLQVGDVVRLGITHSCTTMDRWGLLPVVESWDEADPVVIDLVATVF